MRGVVASAGTQSWKSSDSRGAKLQPAQSGLSSKRRPRIRVRKTTATQSTGPLLPSFSYVLTLLPLLLFLHLLSLHTRYIMVNSSAFVISHQPRTTPCPLDERQRGRGGGRKRQREERVGCAESWQRVREDVRRFPALLGGGQLQRPCAHFHARCWILCSFPYLRHNCLVTSH